MKINERCKIEKAVSTDETRYVLQNAYLDLEDKKNPVLVATDGKMLAVVPVELDEGDTQGYVTPGALKESRKKEHRYRENIRLNGSQEIDGISIPRPKTEDARFPNWRQIANQNENKKEMFTLSINPQMLLKLAEALGSNDSVKLSFYPGCINKRDRKNKWVANAVEVTTSYGKGMIMPMRTSF